MDVLDAIQEWYAARCDGEWEHTYGVHVETLDNPGWAIDIDLADTPLEGKPFDPVNLERSENDWLSCQVSFGKFKGRGGPKNLVEILHLFRDWAA